MATWREYSQIKTIVDAYWTLKEPEKYDEFIKKLVDILEL